MKETWVSRNRRFIVAGLAAAGLAITVALSANIGLWFTGGTYQFENLPQNKLVLPFRTDSIPGHENFQIQATMGVLPLHADRYRIQIDDCLQELTINNIKVTDPAIPFCGADSSLELRLGQYLVPGLNVFLLQAKDTGGMARFSIGVSRLDPLRLILTFIAIVCAGACVAGLCWKKLRAGKYRELWLFFAGGAILRILYMFVTPYTTRAHDSDAHIDYIRYVATHLAMPPASGGWEFHQPPLYYFLTGGYVRVMEMIGRVEGAALMDLQWFSLACSVVALGLALWAGTMLFGPKEKRMLWVYAGIVTVLPGFIFFSSPLSNDALFIVLSFALFAFILRWWRNGQNADWAAVSVLAALAFITKENVLPLLPVVALSVLLRPKTHWKRKVALSAWGAGLFLVLAGWLPVLRLMEADPTRVLDFGNQGMNGALMIGNNIRTYLTFSPIDMLLHTFNNPWTDDERRQYFWEFFVRSMLFGEYSFAEPLQTLSVALLGLLLLQIPLFVRGLWRSATLGFQKNLPVILTLFFLLAGAVFYRFSQPCACNQDYRFVPLLVIPVACFIARGTEGKRGWILQLLAALFIAGGFLFIVLLYWFG